MKKFTAAIVSLFEVRLSEFQVRNDIALASALIILGMVVELVLLRSTPLVPRWPEYAAAIAGALTFIFARRSKVSSRALTFLFLADSACLALSLFSIYSFYTRAQDHWILFPATKIGVLLAGVLAPSLASGLVAVTMLTAEACWQVYHFPPGAPERELGIEPWGVLVAAAAGVFLLIHRMRVRQLEQRAQNLQMEAEAARQVAMAFLDLRDRMNTPLQSIEVAESLLREQKPDIEAIVPRLRRSCEQLRAIGERLREKEHLLKWESSRG